MGRGPLSYAAENGSEAVVGLLLKELAVTNLKDTDGNAVINTHDAVVNFLLLHEGIDLKLGFGAPLIETAH